MEVQVRSRAAGPERSTEEGCIRIEGVEAVRLMAAGRRKARASGLVLARRPTSAEKAQRPDAA